jgi:hypothetical protein
MQTLFEVGFMLAVIVPAAFVVLCAGALLASSFVHRRPHRPVLRAASPTEAALHR